MAGDLPTREEHGVKVIVLPGLGGTGGLLQPFCDAMSASYLTRGLSYDERLVTYPDVIASVRARLPQDDHIIVAESFSGPVAIALAAESVPGLRGIVCVATFARAPRHFPRFAITCARVLPLTSRLFVRLGMPFLMGRWSTPAFRAQFADLLATIPRSALLGRAEAVRQVDLVADLAQLPIPVLYLQATHDRLVPRRAAREFAQVHQIEGPHFLLQANPDAAASAVTDFLAGLNAQTGP